MRGNRTKQTSSEEPTPSNRYDLQIAECRGEQENGAGGQAAYDGANMTLAGVVLMEAVAKVNDESS